MGRQTAGQGYKHQRNNQLMALFVSQKKKNKEKSSTFAAYFGHADVLARHT